MMIFSFNLIIWIEWIIESIKWLEHLKVGSMIIMIDQFSTRSTKKYDCLIFLTWIKKYVFYLNFFTWRENNLPCSKIKGS